MHIGEGQTDTSLLFRTVHEFLEVITHGARTRPSLNGHQRERTAQELDLTAINEEIVKSGDYSSYGDLGERLSRYKDIMELKRAMENLGQAKTHLELKKMIAEVDTNNSGF